MPTLLRLDSSAGGAESRTRALTATFADAWRAAGGTAVERDLHAQMPPRLPDPVLHEPLDRRETGRFPAEEAAQVELIAELLAVDAVVVGAPLYNFSVPTPLKSWLDHVHVPGTLGGSAEPPRPLAGRPAVILVSRGGMYDAGTPTESWDHGTPMIELILGTMFGMEVTVITADAAGAFTNPALASVRARAEAELAQAHAAAAELATRLATAR